MNTEDAFYTFWGPQTNEDTHLTRSMEDYLEMIYRLQKRSGAIRVGDLSKFLHVRPSSVSKMMQRMGAVGLIQSEKYGEILLTKKGQAVGRYLLYRHEVIHDFLKVLNQSENELEQAEKIEHSLNRGTVENLSKLTQKLKKVNSSS